ncbi:MAG: aminotransferase class III-fold pyridoxal phosphate-dependent enzyme [Gaiellaceae bacterium]
MAVIADATAVFPRVLDQAYPIVERGEGVWLYDADDRQILDACGGGAMVTCLGHGRRDIVEAAARQAEELPYYYYHQFTNELQERLADRVLEVAAPEMARARFVTGGSEANEMALRLARQYHVDRGETERWRVISPSQAYHGATFGTLALTGRSSLRHPFEPYLADHLHIPPPGEDGLAALDLALEEAGPETVAAFFCEPVSGAALPAYSPPDSFWTGLEERRDRHGFLVCFDEVVTGFGRTGSWFAGQELPLEPDIVTFGKALGAGYAPLAGLLCREHVYDAVAAESRNFEHGHTWDGAPLFSAIGLAVLDILVEEGLVERVAERGPRLRAELEAALADCSVVGEVRGRGYLLGVELTEPVAPLVDRIAFEHGLLVTSSHTSVDGFVGDQTLLAPAYTATDEELDEMVSRFAATLTDVQNA